MHHRYWPLKTSTALRNPFSSSQKRNQGYFFHCAFMSKRATECVIWGGERGVGRQLALDSMKDSAIHSLFSLLDRNIIHSIIMECGCRRGAKHSQRPIVIASLASFYFPRDLWLQFISRFLHGDEEGIRKLWMLNHLIMAVLLRFPFPLWSLIDADIGNVFFWGGGFYRNMHWFTIKQ